MSRPSSRLLIAAMLLAATALFLQTRGHREIIASHAPLATFPLQLGDWSGVNVSLSQDVLDVLGPGDFLLRIYRDPALPQPDVDLFLAYFRSQRAGDTIHSPKNCLPGAGWLPVESRRIAIALPGLPEFPVNRYVIAKGSQKQLVLYWYWAHGRGIASEYWAKYYLIADSIRMNRSDGALVRVTTSLRDGESADQAQARLLSFAATFSPRLNEFIPQ